jgi:hypothetical protein
MKDEKEVILSQAEQSASPLAPQDTADEPEKSSRRELIERYGRYAIVAAPLLMFVSKAHAIHSKP